MFISWRKLKRLMFVVVLLAAGTVAVIQSNWFQRLMYPLGYKEIIFKYAEQNRLDPYLVAAVIRAESKFVPDARSARGARGLMQVMPETAGWVAKQIPIENFRMEMLEDPGINIRIGTWYLANLRDEFGENPVIILAAYNAGRGNVKHWVEEYGWQGAKDETIIRQIPFQETREYVQRVLYNYKRYRSIYAGKD